MKKLLKGGRVWNIGCYFMENCPILIEDGRIVSVGVDADADEIVDVSELTVLPGLVDVHTHGRAGYDFNTATLDQMKKMKDDYAKNGVTSVFPTLASATEDEWLRSIRDITACGYDGVHLEGCFLNPTKRGAHAPELLQPLSSDALERVLREISIPCHLSAAFELDVDGSIAACAARHGATMGLGHTAATTAEARLAMERGVTSFTHLYNCMPPLHHRAGGAVSVALTSDAWVEIIADGLHVAQEMVHLAWLIKEYDRFVLITDSMEATGCPDGEYAIAGQKVIVKNGRAETLDGALAGSTLNLWDGVKNLMQFADIALEDAILCATLNPAQMVGIDQTVGSIEVGKRADLLLVDDFNDIRGVFANGKRIV
ncbi:MAG: N-acetylglucosamine-6-phosphate deacetylase [Clostridia bacterium]|nr:N-acetylglucosamine-6-phosphate deacetylase [Clostridia bacterium]